MRQILPLCYPPEEQTDVALLDVEKAAEDQAKKQILFELDIANEIYLAKNWSVVHYADLMDNVPVGTASKDSLLAWLNDIIRHDEVVRPGIITLYRKERFDHFTGGMWHARRFCDFVQFTVKKLIDTSFVKNKSKANEFACSVRDWEWFWRAMSVSGLKLLEDCYGRNALKSNVAKGYLGMAFRDRMYLENVGRIVGRSTKNHGSPRNFYVQLKQETQSALKDGLDIQLSIALQHGEHEIFEKWKPSIEGTLLSISREIVPSPEQTAPYPKQTGIVQVEFPFGTPPNPPMSF